MKKAITQNIATLFIIIGGVALFGSAIADQACPPYKNVQYDGSRNLFTDTTGQWSSDSGPWTANLQVINNASARIADGSNPGATGAQCDYYAVYENGAQTTLTLKDLHPVSKYKGTNGAWPKDPQHPGFVLCTLQVSGPVEACEWDEVAAARR